MNTKRNMIAGLALFAVSSIADAERFSMDKEVIEEDFVAWAARENRNYTKKHDFQLRSSIWSSTDEFITQKNKEADESDRVDAVRVAHNNFSDRTDQEKLAILGALLPSHWEGIEDEFETTHTGRESNKRNECPPVYNDVDWVAAGKVSPVKDQGGCGSCYAFTANTVLESMISIVENKAPKRLSEQQIVDCGNTDEYYQFGCSGGWPGVSWDYARDNGIQYDENYPYTGSEQSCSFSGPDVDFAITEYAFLDGYGNSSDPDTILEKLALGPLSIAFQANCQSFFQYSSGVLRSSDCNYDQLDHVIVLTGYNAARDAPYENQYTTSELKWRSRDSDDPEGGCKNEWETYNSYWGDCEWYEHTERTETFSGEPVWTAMNSWGLDWGKSGMVHIAVEDGVGFQGMNKYVEYLAIDDINHL